MTQRPSTGTLVKWVDCRPKLPTSLELLTLFSAMVQLGLALLWWLIPLKKHTTEIQALARWSFGKRFSAVVIACPIPRLDPNNIKNKQVFQFPMLSTFFIIFQHVHLYHAMNLNVSRQLDMASVPIPPGIAVTDIRFRGERIVYELALMDSQAIYGGSLRDQFMCLSEIGTVLRPNNGSTCVYVRLCT